MTDGEVLSAVDAAFASVKRPSHFTNYTHCSECEEHDQVMRSRTKETLAISDVENPGWNPINFLTPEGFAYYFPALARLALSEEGEGFLSSFVPFHLGEAMIEGENLQSFHWLKALNSVQRLAIRDFVHHVDRTRRSTLEEYGVDLAQLDQAVNLWNEFADEA